MTNANETLERSLLELNLALAEILRAVKGAGLERADIRAKLDAALVAVMSELEASVTEPQVDPEPMTRVDPEELDAPPFAALFDDGDDDDDDDEDDLF